MTIDQLLAEIKRRPGCRLANMFELRGEWRALIRDDKSVFIYRSGASAVEALAAAVRDIPPVVDAVDPFA